MYIYVMHGIAFLELIHLPQANPLKLTSRASLSHTYYTQLQSLAFIKCR